MSDAQIYDLYAQKISDITNIPYPYIIALRDNGLLNQKEARDKLIRHDYWKLMKTNKFTHNQILEKLSGIYDVNKRKILYAIKVNPSAYIIVGNVDSSYRKSNTCGTMVYAISVFLNK